ncbi:helix-turn-helix domain-containing protein [Enterovirga rhinocerotis]|uniref:helix-turn-helix domain-containing protein n=1 Tax=Enterovirga rhinocerotis TaxID=1339210 RepID=UPI003CCAB48A
MRRALPAPPSSEEAQRIVGRRVRSFRRRSNLKQVDLAALAGIDRSQLSKLENGYSSPTLDVLLRVARGLERSVSDLVDGIT